MSKKRFCKLVDEGITDEREARPFYTKLIREGEKLGVPDRVLSRIVDIREEEHGHFGKLKDIRREYCKT